MAINNIHLLSHTLCVLEIQKQLSWVVLAQGRSGGFSQDVGQGCNHPDQDSRVCFLSRWFTHKYLLVVDKWPQFLSQGWLITSGHGSWLPHRVSGPRKSKAKVQRILCPSLRSHTPSFPRYPNGYTGQPCSVWEVY